MNSSSSAFTKWKANIWLSSHHKLDKDFQVEKSFVL